MKSSYFYLWGVSTFAPEVVLETDHVVELGRRDLHQLGPFDRFVAVDPSRRHMAVVARPEFLDPDRPAVVLEGQP